MKAHNTYRQIYKLMRLTSVRYMIGLFLIMLSLGFLELLAVGSLFPFIKLLQDPSIVMKNKYLHASYIFFEFTGVNHFLILIGFCIFFIVLLRGAVTLLISYYQSRYALYLNRLISEKTLLHYLKKPYIEQSMSNSSEVLKHVISDVSAAISCIKQLIIMCTNCLTGIAVIALLFWVDPGLVLSIFLFFSLIFITIRKITNKKVSMLSKEIEYKNRVLYRITSESLRSTKEVCLHNSYNFFTDKFSHMLKTMNKVSVYFNCLSSFPGVIINTMAFGILIVILLFLIFTNGGFQAALPIITTIAICIQRLLPSVTAIYNGVGLIRRYGANVDIISNILTAGSNNLKNINNHSSEKIVFEKYFRFKNISFRYPNAKKKALDNVSFNLYKNETLGVVGESGAGKSTLIDIILGILSPTSGEVLCDGYLLGPNASRSHLFGYVPQSVFLLDDSVKANIAFGVPEAEIIEENVWKALRIAQLERVIMGLDDKLESKIGESGAMLSGGQRQRLGIARALYKDPQIIVMDEATNALDQETENEFNASLKKLTKHKTLIIVAHQFSSISLCDKVIQIDKGKILEYGSLNEMCVSSGSFRRLYDIDENRAHS